MMAPLVCCTNDTALQSHLRLLVGEQVHSVALPCHLLSALHAYHSNCLVWDLHGATHRHLDIHAALRVAVPGLRILWVVPLATRSLLEDCFRPETDTFLLSTYLPEELALRLKLECSPAARSSLPAPRAAVTRLIGHAPALEDVRRTLTRVADSDATVLLQGESGTGKEVAARELVAASTRHDAAFIKLNCAAIPSDLLESELFGFESGAFTGALRRTAGKFELAHGGTLFLDEISEIPLTLQAKLLHVLQDGDFSRLGGQQQLSVQVRVIAATNVVLRDAVAAGRFRRDLFYRLEVVTITMPPLRERPEDIPALLEFFVHQYRQHYGRNVSNFSPFVLPVLQRHSWPGNVRELENLVKRYVLFGDEREALQDLLASPSMAISSPPASLTLIEVGRTAARQAEAAAIRQALTETRGNRSQAAKRLRISYKALHHRLQALRMSDVPGALCVSGDAI